MNLNQNAKLTKITKIDENKYIFEFANDNNSYIWNRNTGIDKYDKNMYLINMEPCKYHISIINIINDYINKFSLTYIE